MIDPIMNLDENVERKFFIAGVRHYRAVMVKIVRNHLRLPEGMRSF